jgi:hypothetical protein
MPLDDLKMGNCFEGAAFFIGSAKGEVEGFGVGADGGGERIDPVIFRIRETKISAAGSGEFRIDLNDVAYITNDEKWRPSLSASLGIGSMSRKPDRNNHQETGQ